jgi:hypothetical protein
MIYAYARLDRTGLGNMLFPWARSEVFRSERGCGALAPTWTRWLRMGPWLRREKDKRLYRRLFSSAGYVSGVRKAALMLTHRRVPEPTVVATEMPDLDDCIVEFRGMVGLFDPFAKHHRFIRRRLEEIALDWVRKSVAKEWRSDRHFIAVHIRRGDFQPWDPAKAGRRFMSMQLPVDWYASAIDRAKAIAGTEAETLIFTDGNGGDLQPLLGRPRTRLAVEAPAVCHLLGMANASAIVGSASSFSMWAAFLSDSPAIWFPGVPVPPRPSPLLNAVLDYELGNSTP